MKAAFEIQFNSGSTYCIELAVNADRRRVEREMERGLSRALCRYNIGDA